MLFCCVMNMKKYAIGVDFGTLSGRAVIADISNGEELSVSTYEYPHAVMDKCLPDSTKLGNDWALQYPQDYMDVFYNTIPDIMKKSGVAPKDVIGIGIDFTACTFMPVKKDSTPLCEIGKYSSRPNSYVKLWKHHSAQDKANKINAVAEQRGEKWIERYGGKVSSEWQLPKAWQVLSEDEAVYNDADYFVEAGDWVVWKLTGTLKKSVCAAGFKGMWLGKEGYPSKDFFKALDPKLENFVEDKLNYPFAQLADKVGGLTDGEAEKLGLLPGTPVAAPIIDAHAAIPAVKVTDKGQLLAIIGTSTCHILVSDEEKLVPGICGVVDGGVYPGLYAYEAGQACVGDSFAWFVENCVPESYYEDAKKCGVNIHKYLREKAQKLKAGESGLVALDWWNGNRSTLVDVDLSGMIVGLTISTKPEEIYRAMIEATAYGTKKIVEAYTQNGVPVNKFFASGGISKKDPMMMQIYADVLNMPVYIAGTLQGGALGSAIYASVAAGEENGGYKDMFTAAEKMGKLDDKVYTPNEKNVKTYEILYNEYSKLYDYFGKGENNVMKSLKRLKNL